MFVKAAAFTTTLALMSVIVGVMLMFTWNQVMPDLFGVSRLTFLDGFWLFWFAQAWNGGVFRLYKGFTKV